MLAGAQRVENPGWNDVGGVAATAGAYIDFGPRTGRQGVRGGQRRWGHDNATRRAEPGRAEPSGNERMERATPKIFLSILLEEATAPEIFLPRSSKFQISLR